MFQVEMAMECLGLKYISLSINSSPFTSPLFLTLLLTLGKLTFLSQLWNKYQSLLPHSNRQTIIYGHDSRRGLQLSEYSKGVDTGCVKGGKLTALIIEEGKWGGNVRMTSVSVKCKDYRTKKKAQVGLGQA